MGYADYYKDLTPLVEFDPRAFIKDTQVSEDVCGFVLALALAYNDFKFYHISYNMFLKSTPQGDFKRTSIWGEYSGIRLHIIRLHIGFINELFALIQDNKKILKDSFLKEVIKSLPANTQKYWGNLVKVALEDEVAPRRTNPISMVRNKVIFHYNTKELIAGYKNGFFQNGEPVENACISLGNMLAQVRLYFADRAVQVYLEKHLKIDDDFFKSFNQSVHNINFSLYHICASFITKRGFAWKQPK